LGLAIRTIRHNQRILQEELAERAGIHPTWISHIESGRVNPTIKNLALLSEGLQIKLSELIALAEELDGVMQSKLLQPEAK
jgi:transcriptional regulator with XRE-family HTH domain